MKPMIKKILLSAAMVASVTTVWAFNAQNFDAPVGDCDWYGQLALTSFRSDLPFSGSLASVGNATFRETNVVRRAGAPAYVERSFQGVEGKGRDPEVGEFVWSVDEERQQDAEAAGLVTTVRAHQADVDLPASADIRFFAKVRISSQPDRIYKSVQQVRFVSDYIRTYPFEKEEFSIAEPVDFYDESGEIAFRIDGGNASISTSSGS